MRSLIENEDLRIVYTEQKEIPFVVETEQNSENIQYIVQWTVEQHEKALEDKDILHLLIKDTDGSNVGYAIVKVLENLNNSIELMRMVITKKGCGYGKKSISLIKKWCFEIKKAHRLWLDVKESNLRAQHVYSTLGFIKEGVLRECVKDGNNYQSLIVMSILSHDY